MQLFARGQMGQVRKRREDTGVGRNLADQRPLASAVFFSTEPTFGRIADIAGRPEKNLRRGAGDDYEIRN